MRTLQQVISGQVLSNCHPQTIDSSLIDTNYGDRVFLCATKGHDRYLRYGDDDNKMEQLTFLVLSLISGAFVLP